MPVLQGFCKIDKDNILGTQELGEDWLNLFPRKKIYICIYIYIYIYIYYVTYM
jgi:hypothetical protein